MHSFKLTSLSYSQTKLLLKLLFHLLHLLHQRRTLRSLLVPFQYSPPFALRTCLRTPDIRLRAVHQHRVLPLEGDHSPVEVRDFFCLSDDFDIQVFVRAFSVVVGVGVGVGVGIDVDASNGGGYKGVVFLWHEG
jgi:hypothetical protein